jgi:hypothetical protein
MGMNWKILTGILAVLLVVGASFYLYHPTSESRAIEPNGTAPLFDSPVVDGMKTYKSPVLHFELAYPQDLSVKEYGDADTSTIVFEDPKGEKGFQVFVVPYSGDTVSDKRFKMDEPSGVMKDPTQVVIDGTTAIAFWSSNTLFGETREVWFIKNGFLYEVTTYKDLDSWLAGVMATWKFI